MSRRKRSRAAARVDRGSSAAVGGRAVASPLRLALVVLVALKVLGLVLLFDPTSAAPFEGPKSVFSLASASVLAALVALAVFESGTWKLLRSRLHLAVGAFALANLVAVLFAQDRYVALFGAQRRLGLTFVLDMVVLYAAVSVGFRAVRDWAVLGATVAFAGALAIGYGLVQSLGLDPIPWVDDVRVRPPSTFGNPDKFGHFLGATLAVALAVAVLPWRELPRRVRFAAGVYAGGSFVMAAIVATRGTLVGLAVALPLIAFLYLAASRGRPRSRTILVGAAGTVAVIALAAAVTLATPLGERVRGGFADVASQQRGIVALVALRAFADRPLSGHGPDNFGVIYPLYRPTNANPFIGQDSAHSSLLQALATTGLPGALTLVALAAVSLVLLWRAVPAHPVAAPLLVGAAAYWAHGLVAFGSVSVDWMAWVAAGGAASLSGAGVAVARLRVPPVVQAAVIGAGLVLALSGYGALQAGREAHAARGGPSDRTLQAANRAVALDGGRAEYWFALAQLHRQRGALAEAARAYREAAERAPYVSAYWSNLALALGDLVMRGDRSLGDKNTALEAARKAVAADPRSPRPHVAVAVVSNALGDPIAALEAVTLAIRLDPAQPEYDAIASDTALRLTDANAARAALERIIPFKDSAVLRLALAQTSLKLNDVAAARVHVRRAIDLDPQNAAARELSRQIGP